MKIIKIFYFNLSILLVSVFLYSCSSHVTVGNIKMLFDCKNCGISSDGVLSFDITKSYTSDEDYNLIISNLKDDMVIFNESFFTASYDDELVQNPFLTQNPNIQTSWSSAYQSSTGKTSQYLYDWLTNYYNKYNTEYAQSQSITNTFIPNHLKPLPGKTKIKYQVDNYYSTLFNLAIIKSKHQIQYKIYYTDWKEVDSTMQNFIRKNLKLTIVYKLLNDEKWRTANITIIPTNCELVLNNVKI